jgi:hypothetical protein
LETETTEYVIHSNSVGPVADALTTTKSQYVQDSVGFGRKIKATVAAYQPLTTISYSSEFKGAKVTETTAILSPTTAALKRPAMSSNSALMRRVTGKNFVVNWDGFAMR